MIQTKPTNQEIARVFSEIADLLEKQEANPFRVRAYRRGADTVKEQKMPVADLVEEEGIEALEELPNIGQSLARLIIEYAHKGRSTLLQRLRGEVTPEEIFEQVPGIGEDLAGRLVKELDIHSLEELEQAAHDGRLEAVEGFGEKRIRAVKTSLAGMLGGYAQRSARERTGVARSQREQPPVALLLDIDRTYRERAEAGKLRKIAPRRFNPEEKAWLPVYHTEKDEWEFTALFSNTARAHELERTRDWVVIYFERGGQEGQCTVVTETRGPLEGKRVIRGREKECRRYYFD